MTKCTVPGCRKRPVTRGYCVAHYRRWMRHGDPTGGRASRGEFVPCSIQGCERGHYAHGLCDPHYKRQRKYGDPLKAAFVRPPTGAVDEFLSAAIDAQDDGPCIIWPFAKDGSGYGQFGRQGRKYAAHRFICEAKHGPPPSPKMDAAHSCGNGHLACCNPHHLRWASRKENVADMFAHGRR